MINAEQARWLAGRALARPGRGARGALGKRLKVLADSGRLGGQVVFLAQWECGRDAVIKVFGHRDRAHRQHDALLEVAGRSDRVVRVLEYAPRHGVMVLEWLGHRTLGDELGGADHLERVTEIADWVRAFHREVATGRRRLEAERWLAYPRRLDAEIPPLRRAWRRWRRLARLGQRVRAAQGQALAVGHAHNDLRPENLIRAPRGIVAIDRPAPGTRWLVDDVAGLAMWLEKQRFLQRLRGRRWPGDVATDQGILARRALGAQDAGLLPLAIARRALVLWLQALARDPGTPWAAHLDARCATLLGR